MRHISAIISAAKSIRFPKANSVMDPIGVELSWRVFKIVEKLWTALTANVATMLGCQVER